MNATLDSNMNLLKTSQMSLLPQHCRNAFIKGWPRIENILPQIDPC